MQRNTSYLSIASSRANSQPFCSPFLPPLTPIFTCFTGPLVACSPFLPPLIPNLHMLQGAASCLKCGPSFCCRLTSAVEKQRQLRQKPHIAGSDAVYLVTSVCDLSATEFVRSFITNTIVGLYYQ